MLLRIHAGVSKQGGGWRSIVGFRKTGRGDMVLQRQSKGVNGKERREKMRRRMKWEMRRSAGSRSPPAGGRGPKGSQARFALKIQS